MSGGLFGSCVPEEAGYERASPDRPGKCAVATAGARGVREETDDPKTLAARQSRARRGCEAPFCFLKRDLKVVKYILCSLPAEACVCLVSGGAKPLSRRLVPQSGPPRVSACGRSVEVLQVSRGGGVSLTRGCLLSSLPDSFIFIFFPLVLLVTQGPLGGTFGGHVDDCG